MTLAPAPASFRDAQSGEPAFGAYCGRLAAIDPGGLGLRDRIARRKRWVYAAITTEQVWISCAVVLTGYASTAFAFVYDLARRQMIVERAALAAAPAARVASDLHARGTVATFTRGRSSLALTRTEAALELRIRMRDLEVDAAIDERSGPPAVSAIARLGDNAGKHRLWSATEKRGLLPVSGRARVGPREIALDGGTGGYDYTHGLLPRHTKWHWAFGLGTATRDGEDRAVPFGFNLVQGFVGAAECAAFVGNEVVAMAEPAFAFDAAAPSRPWRVEGRGIDLAFTPGAVHAKASNLLIVRSRFVQPVGTFEGNMRIGDRTLAFAGLPGVVEDQDVLW